MKKIITLLLSLSCLFAVGGFSACNEKNSSPSESNASQSADDTSTTPTVAGTEGLVYSLTYFNGQEAYMLTDYFGTDATVTVPQTIAGKQVVAIGKNAFENQKTITSITLPNSVTSIGSSAFFYCDALKEISMPDSVTSIGNSAFEGCAALKEISIPNGVTAIKQRTFFGCTALTNITLPDSVTLIEESAFSDCAALTNISIPKNVTSIGEYCFYDCTSLTEISIPDSITSIGDNLFKGCKSISRFIVGENNANYKSIDGNLYSKDGTVLLQYALGKEDTTFTVPDGVTTIKGDILIYECSLSRLIIPISVTIITSECHSYGWWSIYYMGTEEQWRAIVGSDRFNVNNKIYITYLSNADN